MFNFLMPTKIITGEFAVSKNSNDLILGTKAMIVTGKTSGAKSGALSDVIEVFKDNNISYLVYDKIGNNPTIEETVEGGKAAMKFGCGNRRRLTS